MAGSNKLELVIQIDPRQANSATASINKGLSSLEREAMRASASASHSFDGMTKSMFKGALGATAVYDMAKRAFGALKQFTLGAIQIQDDMGKMAQKVGLSVEELSALKHVADLSDLSLEQLSTGVGILSRNMLEAAQGSKEQRQNFALLGVEVKNAGGTLRSSGAILEDIANKFQALPDGAFKTAMSMQLLGRSGKEMIPLLNMGGTEIRRMMEEAQKLGIVISGDTARAAEHFNDNLTRLRAGVQGLAFRIAEDLLPKLNELSDQAVKWAKEGGIKELAAHIREAAEWLKYLGIYIVSYAVVSHLLKVAAAARTLAAGIAAVNVAMLANPWVLAGAGITAFGVIIWKEHQKNLQFVKGLESANKEAQILAKLKAGFTVEQIQKSGYSEEQIKFALTKGQPLPEFGPQKFERVTGLGQDIISRGAGKIEPPVLAENKEIDKIQKFIRDAERAAREFRRSAEEALMGGPAREIAEVAREIDKLTTYVDDKGAERKIQLSADARSNIEAGLQLKIQALQKESVKKVVEEYQEAARLRFAAETDLYRQKLGLEQNLADRQLENLKQLVGSQEDRYAAERDAALRRLEMEEAEIPGLSPQEETARKMALEGQKAEIEVRYIRQVHEAKMALFDLETSEILVQVNLQKEVLRVAGGDTAKISQMISELEAQRGRLRGEIDIQTQGAIDRTTEEAAIRQAAAVRDRQMEMFSSFKRQAEGVFDALLTKSESVWSAIANSFKTAILTAIKEVVTSNVARALTQMFGGMRIPGGGGMGGGGLGIAGAAAGMIPGFGGGAGFPSAASGIAPFLPNTAPVGGGIGIPMGTGGGSGGGLFNLGALKGMGSGLKQFLGMEKPAGFMGPQLPFGQLSMGGKLSALGHSNAALLGGGMLALMGVQRGGWSGLGMTTGGGALIGFKYGGPLGALIGGLAGFGVGLAGLFRKSPEQKVKEKVQNAYGVDISDKKLLSQIAEMAKQNFAANFDTAIRSQQVVELVRLYALTTGQSTSRLPKEVTSSTIVQQEGKLAQQATYLHGRKVEAGGSIPALASGIKFVPRDMLAILHRGERVTPAKENQPAAFLQNARDLMANATRGIFGQGPAAGLGGISGYFGKSIGRWLSSSIAASLPGASLENSRSRPFSINRAINISIGQTSDALKQEIQGILDESDRTVQSAVMRASKKNFGRREITALQLNPGTLMS